MKVFISWSGDLSRALAVELRDWLPMVVHQVDAWVSSRDIDPGKRWALVLGRELAESDFAVICLTQDNLRSPWILFEAGAVARSLEARVVPLLFGITQSNLDGPLAQFQSVQADRTGIEKLISALYDSSKSMLDASQRAIVFARLWPVFEERLIALTKQIQQATEIESPIDLVADLSAGSKRLLAIMPEKDILERLKQEKARLRRELEYLNAEEEKLTQQQAPISLLERAIEPTKHRLSQLESTLEMTLDLSFSKLSPSQIEILRHLVAPSGTRLVQPSESRLTRSSQADLEALVQWGIITLSDQGMVLIHDLVADYISKRFGAA